MRVAWDVGHVYYTDVLHGTTVISRDDSRARRKLFVWFVTSETSTRLAHRVRWNAKRFHIATPGVEIHFFQSKSRIRVGRVRGKGGRRNWGGFSAKGQGWREAGNRAEEQREPPYETVICTDSAIFLHLLPPPPMPPFLCPYPLIWSPQPNECTSTAGLTLTVAGRSFQLDQYRSRKTQEHFRLRLLLLRIRLVLPAQVYPYMDSFVFFSRFEGMVLSFFFTVCSVLPTFCNFRFFVSTRPRHAPVPAPRRKLDPVIILFDRSAVGPGTGDDPSNVARYL